MGKADFLSVNSYALIIYFLMGRPLGHPEGTHGNSGEIVKFFKFYFSRGELFSFGNDFAGPRGHTHWIGSSFGQQCIAFSRHYFISICCGCSYFPLGKGFLLFILCPLPRGFEWFLFVTKNNSPGGCPGGRPTGKQMIRALL